MANDGWTAWRGRNTLTFVDHELAGDKVPKLDDHIRYLRNPVKDKPCQIVVSLWNLRRLNSFKRVAKVRRTARVAASNRAAWDYRRAKLHAAFEESSALWSCASSPKASLESDLQIVNSNATLLHRAAEVASRSEIVDIRSQFFSKYSALPEAQSSARSHQQQGTGSLCVTEGEEAQSGRRSRRSCVSQAGTQADVHGNVQVVARPAGGWQLLLRMHFHSHHSFGHLRA